MMLRRRCSFLVWAFAHKYCKTSAIEWTTGQSLPLIGGVLLQLRQCARGLILRGL
jgi:hypothetical protein